MTEYIEREALKILFAGACAECRDSCAEFDGIEADCNQCLLNGVIKDAKSIPAADARPVVRGKWILYKDRDSTGKFEYVQWSCSACKSNVRTGQPRFDRTLRERPRFNYCPNCGADMREES